MRVGTLYGAVKRADTNLERDGHLPVAAGPEPHGLRHTWASLALAPGEPLPSMLKETGHKTGALAA